ncbi:capsule biosynthesis protein [Citrobacter freundii]|nr:capsule biosynthesis protein [Citrobacter freundii]MBC6508497.1 capsule biosynthesis protein [Citrobacter freundii]
MKKCYLSLRMRISEIKTISIQKYLFCIIIVLPVSALLFYLMIFSQPRYMSESTVAIKRPTESENSSLSVGMLLGAASSGTAEDALYLKEYILSADMMHILDKQLGIRLAWSQSGLDFIYHLPQDSTPEHFLRYYRERIAVIYNDKAGLLTIQTQGFTPEFAWRFNQAVLKESERFINELSHRIARDQLRFADEELLQARKRLDKSKAELLAYQNENNVFDPHASAIAAGALINTLIAKKIDLEAELRNQLTYLREDAPQVVITRNAVNSLQAQIDKEQGAITAPGPNKLNQMSADFEEIKSRAAFDTDLYSLALKAKEKIRLESSRKLKVLAVISSPQRPEESSYPEKLYLLTSWLLVCGLLFGTVKLVLSVIEDHQD